HTRELQVHELSQYCIKALLFAKDHTFQYGKQKHVVRTELSFRKEGYNFAVWYFWVKSFFKSNFHGDLIADMFVTLTSKTDAEPRSVSTNMVEEHGIFLPSTN
ncbi:unnamed protein product, partial [Didymodactylos carnosus]